MFPTPASRPGRSAASVDRLGGGMIKIAETVTQGSQSSVPFSSIPSGYRDLYVVINGRGTTSATTVTALLQVNGDSGANYTYAALEVNGTGGSASPGAGGATSMWMGLLAAATASSNQAGSIGVFIRNYASTVFFKQFSGNGSYSAGAGAVNMGLDIVGGYWASTAAVTALTVLLSAGAFVDGSVVTVYGVG